MIVLDTHVLVWLRADPGRLTAAAHREITGAGELAIADITSWELAMLARRGRITITGSLQSYLASIASSVRLLPLTAPIAAAVGGLGADFGSGDPADQIIYSTALVHAAPLVSADRRLRAYDGAVVWE